MHYCPLNPKLNNNQRQEIKTKFLTGIFSIRSLSKEYNIFPSSIKKILNKDFIDTNSYARNHLTEFNRDAFKKESPETFYWIGFIMADGNIYRKNRKNKLSIDLKNDDKNHLEKFIKFLDYKNKKLTYNEKNNSIRFEVDSRTIVEDLKKYGITERKSLTATPQNIPKKYVKDFILGYSDGDGCISKTKIGWGWYCLGSINMMNFIFNYINKIFLTNIHILKFHSIWKLQIQSQKLLLNFLKHLYSENPVYSLELKYNLFLQYQAGTK